MPIPADGVSIAFLPGGEVRIELVEPTDAATARRVSVAVDGVELIDTAPRPGAEGPVAFLHPRSCHGVLVELIEAPGGPAWTSLYPAGFTAPG